MLLITINFILVYYYSIVTNSYFTDMSIIVFLIAFSFIKLTLFKDHLIFSHKLFRLLLIFIFHTNFLNLISIISQLPIIVKY
jgi:hypothetical protein